MVLVASELAYLHHSVTRRTLVNLASSCDRGQAAPVVDFWCSSSSTSLNLVDKVIYVKSLRPHSTFHSVKMPKFKREAEKW